MSEATDHGDRVFSIIDDAHVILHSRGKYRQAKAYQRLGMLYAGTGGAFVRVMNTGVTSDPNTKWADLIGLDKFGLRRP